MPDYGAVMPLLRLNRALSSIGFLVKRNTWDNVQKEFYQYNRNFLDNFFRSLT